MEEETAPAESKIPPMELEVSAVMKPRYQANQEGPGFTLQDWEVVPWKPTDFQVELAAWVKNPKETSASWANRGILLQHYDAWMNRPLAEIIKGLQTLINFTGEHPKFKQIAVVRRLLTDLKKITRCQLWKELRKRGIPIEQIDGKPTSELYQLWKDDKIRETTKDCRTVAAVPSAPPEEEPETMVELYPDLKNLHID
ncbi:hypothetical protein Y1Q_0024223 [Alligator mississippiensis]|uniref:Uncharacterized protein n=1 Tax=Alligator mississippiensis TaxID=8496 RepID=A0A151NJ07_ALLMI|nr:hypothetical protein Y1Q_0024223 [Alligator mississippiensis]